MNAQTVNAYFSPPDNEVSESFPRSRSTSLPETDSPILPSRRKIVFPAGILQPPFFNAEWPSYLSYGSFGAVAAHELAHAFDSTGSKYDDRGFFRDWWSNVSRLFSSCPLGSRFSSRLPLPFPSRQDKQHQVDLSFCFQSTVKAFEERANCIAEQYSKFYVRSLPRSRRCFRKIELTFCSTLPFLPSSLRVIST